MQIIYLICFLEAIASLKAGLSVTQSVRNQLPFKFSKLYKFYRSCSYSGNSLHAAQAGHTGHTGHVSHASHTDLAVHVDHVTHEEFAAHVEYASKFVTGNPRQRISRPFLYFIFFSSYTQRLAEL